MKTPWHITQTALFAFQRRVAPDTPLDEIRQWLIQNAHTGAQLRARCHLGNLQFRLEHPWGKPDAVLVVKTDPYTKQGVVVTCAWWDDTTPIPPEELALALELAAARAASPPPAPPKPPQPVPKPAPPPTTPIPLVLVRYELPLPPEGLSSPEGGQLSLDFLREGWSMDHTKLQIEETTRWRVYLLHLQALLNTQPHGVQLRQVYDALRLLKQHSRELSEERSRAKARLGQTFFLRSLRSVMEERLGEDETNTIFALAEELKEARIQESLRVEEGESLEQNLDS